MAQFCFTPLIPPCLSQQDLCNPIESNFNTDTSIQQIKLILGSAEAYYGVREVSVSIVIDVLAAVTHVEPRRISSVIDSQHSNLKVGGDIFDEPDTRQAASWLPSRDE